MSGFGYERFDALQNAKIEIFLSSAKTDRAALVAFAIHETQVDKAGEPYAGHPVRVANNVEAFPGYAELSDEQRVAASNAAWLHDVVEDSADAGWPQLTSQDLADWGFDQTTIEIVELLSKNLHTNDDGGFDKEGYFDGIVNHALARMVKICDIADNCNQERVEAMLQLGLKSKVPKYRMLLEDFFDLSLAERDWFEQRILEPAWPPALDEIFDHYK